MADPCVDVGAGGLRELPDVFTGGQRRVVVHAQLSPAVPTTHVCSQDAASRREHGLQTRHTGVT